MLHYLGHSCVRSRIGLDHSQTNHFRLIVHLLRIFVLDVTGDIFFQFIQHCESCHPYSFYHLYCLASYRSVVFGGWQPCIHGLNVRASCTHSSSRCRLGSRCMTANVTPNIKNFRPCACVSCFALFCICQLSHPQLMLWNEGFAPLLIVVLFFLQVPGQTSLS